MRPMTISLWPGREYITRNPILITFFTFSVLFYLSLPSFIFRNKIFCVMTPRPNFTSVVNSFIAWLTLILAAVGWLVGVPYLKILVALASIYPTVIIGISLLESDRGFRVWNYLGNATGLVILLLASAVISFYVSNPVSVYTSNSLFGSACLLVALFAAVVGRIIKRKEESED